MKRILIAVALVLFIGGCTDDDTARRVLEQQGYTNIQMTGYNWAACSEDDTYHTGFRALSPDGKHTITGTVCAGVLFKNSTIRFD